MEELRASDPRRDGRLARDLSLDRDLTAMMKIGFLSLRGNLERRIPIRRRRRHVEEHQDRGPIEPRSRCDRAAIVDPAAWNLFHDRRSSFPEHQEHDRRSIVVNRGRSREDRGLILRLLLKRDSSHFGPELKPQRRSIQTAPTTP